MTKIKCCGMFCERDIEAVNRARPDFCGFIVDFPRSHRSITAQQARELRALLADGIEAVGVFVNKREDALARIARECGFDAVQLHGDEGEAYLKNLRKLTDKTIIKAFKVRNECDVARAEQSSADYILYDNGQGGGVPFDWKILEHATRRYFLAGGLTVDTIPDAILALNPYAIDLSSGLETSKRKDPDKIYRAVQVVRRKQPSRRPVQDLTEKGHRP